MYIKIFGIIKTKRFSQQACREGLEQKEKQKVLRALKRAGFFIDILMVLFNRMYTLRNQLIHGGAT